MQKKLNVEEASKQIRHCYDARTTKADKEDLSKHPSRLLQQFCILPTVELTFVQKQDCEIDKLQLCSTLSHLISKYYVVRISLASGK